SDAAQKFAEAQEAYDVLSDASKRKLYDQFGHAGVTGAAANGTGPDMRNPFGQQGPLQQTWSSGDASGWSEVDADTFDSVFGDLFGARRGGRGRGAGARGPGPREHPPRAGDDVEHTILIPFAVAASGGTETLRVTGPDSTTQSLDVKIPAGVRSGAKM